MARNLTPKQEGFCAAVLKGATASDAYRQAYDADRMTNKQIWEESSKLMAHPKVSQRLAALRAPVLKRLEYGYEQAMDEANRAFALAEHLKVPAAMVAAATLRAKLSGLMVEDRKNARTPLQEVSTETLEQLEQVLGRLDGTGDDAGSRPANRVTH